MIRVHGDEFEGSLKDTEADSEICGDIRPVHNSGSA